MEFQAKSLFIVYVTTDKDIYRRYFYYENKNVIKYEDIYAEIMDIDEKILYVFGIVINDCLEYPSYPYMTIMNDVSVKNYMFDEVSSVDIKGNKSCSFYSLKYDYTMEVKILQNKDVINVMISSNIENKIFNLEFKKDKSMFEYNNKSSYITKDSEIRDNVSLKTKEISEKMKKMNTKCKKIAVDKSFED